jgi:leader peptidase (prepilin peptidase)/N-methyltransferase
LIVAPPDARSGALLRSPRIVLGAGQPFVTPPGELDPSFEGERIPRRHGETRRVSRRLLAVLVWVALAVACVVVFGWSLEALVGAAGCAVLVAVTVTDLERRIIPNRIVLPATAAALVVQTLREPGIEWLVAALAAGGFFLVLALVYPAGLGMGDVKLAVFMGAWLGRDVFFALLVGSLLGAVAAIGVLALRGGKGRRAMLPYGPFLAVGGVVGLFFGDAMLDAWLG